MPKDDIRGSFVEHELLTICEVARITLDNPAERLAVAEVLDVTDDELVLLLRKLNQVMGKP